MLNENRVTGPGYEDTPNPPRVARQLLSFFLPATLREPVLGDLEEEFAGRLYSTGSRNQASRWYWRQALQSACQFFWQQRGDGMAYLISAILFLAIIGLALMTSQVGLWLISPPVIILTVPTALILGIGATSMQAARSALAMSLTDAGIRSAADVNLATRFLRVTGNQFLLVGGVAFFLGTIQLLIGFSQNPGLVASGSHFARLGVAMLPLLYGMLFKCLFYSAEQKLLWKYADQ